MGQWVERVAERRGRAIASVALARKLAGILYAIWRDGSTYQSARAATVAGAAGSPPRAISPDTVRELLHGRTD
jgi:hypothetical protein